MPQSTDAAATGAGSVIPKIAELDGLRGIAIIMVLMHHVASEGALWAHPVAKVLLYPFSTLGWSGVDLFFVLSGFLITSILLECKQQQSRHYFRNFYARRILRIMPIYYLSLVLVFVVERRYFDRWIGTAGAHQPYYWAYLQNWLEVCRVRTGFSSGWIGHLWSLGLEEQFYLVWPVVVWLLRPRWLLTLGLSLLGCGLVARLIFSRIATTGFEAYSFSSFTRYDELVFGAMVAISQNDHREWMERFARRASALLLSGLVVALALTIACFGVWAPQIGNPLMRIVGYTLLGGIAAGSIIQALHGETDGFFRRLLRKRWLCFVGAISYGLYIYHTLVQCVVSDWLHDCPRIDGVVGVAVITLAVTFLVAYFSYNLVEVPVMRLKRHFAK